MNQTIWDYSSQRDIPKLSYTDRMVDGVESFFQMDENHTIYKAIVDINRPTISGFNQCCERTAQWQESRLALS